MPWQRNLPVPVVAELSKLAAEEVRSEDDNANLNKIARPLKAELERRTFPPS